MSYRCWYWPLFPFWTSDRSVRPNLELPAEWAQRGGEIEVRGPFWDRERVTYYRPRREDINLAGSLFPGFFGLPPVHAENPPWKRVYEELVSLGANPHEVIRLKCYDALALLCDLRRKKLAEQLTRTTQAFQNELLLLRLEAEIEDIQKKNPVLSAPPSKKKVSRPKKKVSRSKKKVSRSKKKVSSPQLPNQMSQTRDDTTLELQAAPVAESKAPATSGGGKGGLVNAPRNYLRGWKDICRKLQPSGEVWRTLEAKAKWLKRLNREHDGPILSIGPGNPPIVEEQKLLDWWNTLPEEIRQKASQKLKTQPLNSRNEMTL